MRSQQGDQSRLLWSALLQRVVPTTIHVQSYSQGFDTEVRDNFISIRMRGMSVYSAVSNLSIAPHLMPPRIGSSTPSCPNQVQVVINKRQMNG